MEEHAAVVDVSRYRPAPGKRDDLLAQMKKIAEQASKADGCFGAQVCTSNGDGGVLVAVSRWKSAQALDTFARDVATAAARDKLTDLLGGRAQHEHLTPV
jgi:quinol monooxygenase YgiN